MKLLKNKFVIGSLVLVLAGVGWYAYGKTKAGSAAISYVTVPVVKGTLTVAVTGTGQVAAQNQLDIKPASSAAVVEVDVKQGQAVKAGQRIAVLDEKSAASSLAQAKASLDSAKANYDSVVAGSTDTAIQLAKSAVTSAQLALDKAKSDYPTIQKQQAQALANAYSNLLNTSLEAIPTANNFSTATVSVSGSYAGTDQGQYVITLYLGGDGLHYTVSGLEISTFGLISRGVPEPVGSKGVFITFTSTGTLSNNDSWTITLPNTLASGYLSANNSYQSAILSQQQALANAQNTINVDQISLNNVQTQLQQQLNGSTQAQIEQASASVTNAQAQLQTAQNNYNNNIITAPFDGIIASLNANVGQQVAGNTAAAGSTALATLITQQKIAVISLNEVDVAKIKIGGKSTLTFDAIDGLDMTGTVAQIDAIGTVSQGVVNYNVKITLDTDDARIKPGMSVTANIITDVKSDILMAPNAAVKLQGSNNYVQVLQNGKPVSVTVQTGLSNDTDTEISGNIKEGDQVVAQTISSAKPATATQQNSILPTGGGGFGGVRTGGGGAGRPGG